MRPFVIKVEAAGENIVKPHVDRWMKSASVAVLALAIAGCGGAATASSSPAPSASVAPSSAAATPAASASEKAKTIAIISPDYAAQPAAKEAIDLFMTEAKSQGYAVTLTDTNSDNAAINGEITTAVSQRVDAIVTAFGTPQEFGEGLAKAGAANVPVFGLDTGGVVAPTLVNVTTDNKYLGEASAQAMIDAMGGTGSVIMIAFDAFEPVHLRAVAAKALFEAKGIKILEYKQGDPADSTGKAKAIVGDLLTKYPKGTVQGVWAAWDASALGAYQATQAAGRSEVFITGVDGQSFAQAEVAKGLNWIATVRQDWPTIAKTLVGIITDHFAGKDPTDTTVFVPAILITKANAKP
jgi:ribose transport system substrate-binding protein